MEKINMPPVVYSFTMDSKITRCFDCPCHYYSYDEECSCNLLDEPTTTTIDPDKEILPNCPLNMIL